jgi:hypothetical protein
MDIDMNIDKDTSTGTATDKDIDTEESKLLFWSESEKIDANMSFLDFLCFEHKILKQIEANFIFIDLRIEAIIQQIRLWFALFL